jgi:hypothetical protein
VLGSRFSLLNIAPVFFCEQILIDPVLPALGKNDRAVHVVVQSFLVHAFAQIIISEVRDCSCWCAGQTQLHCSGARKLKTRVFLDRIETAACDGSVLVTRDSRLFSIIFNGLGAIGCVLA